MLIGVLKLHLISSTEMRSRDEIMLERIAMKHLTSQRTSQRGSVSWSNLALESRSLVRGSMLTYPYLHLKSLNLVSANIVRI